MRKYVLIVAGGKGLRMGGDLPKQFIPLEGKPVLMHTLEAFHRWDASAELVLVLPEDHQSYWNMLCREIGCKVPHRIANGGETRFHSVRNGLQFLSEEIGNTSGRNEKVLIAVHDGVRPFVSSEVIAACFDEAEKSGAAIPVIPMIDSLRETDEKGSHPVDRSRYFAVQTPQVFCSELLLKAYGQEFSALFTDDASVVEAMGEVIHMVTGNRENIKITTPFDLLVAESLILKQIPDKER
ncbi:2-C-methyl-D-erythritol 4-phosphate cytidylyltransferase [Parabacteroides sp. GYB001]|uniref:2-C-methyl-D-erythritol 4-phosphate cytidylyltransferase n=1 Tax=Parabacteroides leei TaxID=2939491 RepID=UPI0020173346|nr:2-C-methyl-D-erythritol 4-phosphate cytidylyltransferase [Parabacteroides leei]MCL3852856.1 2-C-methyl-D-erythritol 4-phosphate cytidylyltransferase [Parabacteroides leei]